MYLALIGEYPLTKGKKIMDSPTEERNLCKVKTKQKLKILMISTEQNNKSPCTTDTLRD